MRLAIALVWLAGSAAAQPAPTPSGPALLAHVQTFYANVTDVRAKVRYVETDQAAQTTTTQDGLLWIQRPASYRYDFVRKVRKRVQLSRTVISDGTTEWTIDHPGMWYRPSGPPSHFGAALQFVTTTRFTYRSLAVATAGENLELVIHPMPGSPYLSITFLVEPTSGRVRATTLVEQLTGNSHRFNFYEPSFDPKTSASTFQFSPPKNYAKKP